LLLIYLIGHSKLDSTHFSAQPDSIRFGKVRT
jgi:hypothetical protein